MGLSSLPQIAGANQEPDGAAPGSSGGPEVEVGEVVVHGLRRRVLAAGEGPPLLLLHGIAGSADEFMGVLPRFAARFHAVAADAPGHGFSDKPETHRYDVESYVEATLGLMDALGMAQAPVIAVTGAGTVALSIALEQPERIGELVLVDAAGLGRHVSWNYRLAALPLARHAMRRSTRRRIEAFGRALCYTPDRLPDGWVDRRVQIWAAPGAVEAFVKTARSSLGWRGQKLEFSGRLAEVRQPTLIVWGRQDPIIPVAHGIAAARAIPRAHLHIFERCGHMPLWEYPETFVSVVMEFLGASSATA